MRIVLIDNFDSFSWNLADMLGALGADVRVERNNVPLATLLSLQPTHLVISPGPGRPPNDTGVTCAAIEHFAGKLPILGVCLGHQAIGHIYGGRIERAKRIMHGKSSTIVLAQSDATGTGGPQDPLRPDRLFHGVGDGNAFTAGRYHSLVIERTSCPECLQVIASDDQDGEIMAVRHRQIPHLYGVQFHPESVLTAPSPERFQHESYGRRLLQNFLQLPGN